ncbi:MAG: sulfatase-like hydrolase/transferase [Bacteroidales bacterium]|nr:sulfatase-like hydrolase/transferase [Bacteroidales bacterium]
MKFKFLILLPLIGLLSCSTPNEYLLTSPDGNVQLTVSNKENASMFSVIYKGDVIIKQSIVGLQVNETDFTKDVSITNFSENEYDETWTTINGKQPTVRNYYKEYKFKLENIKSGNEFYEIIFRLYNDGFAYRYHFPKQDSFDILTLSKELTRINFSDDFTYWAYNGENNNLGPLKGSDTSLMSIRTPIVMEFTDKLFLSIHEAEIIRYAPFDLISEGGKHTLEFFISETKDSLPVKTSWRAFILGNKPGDLVESNLLVNLNEPCKIEDPSWIKPGKVMWDWRVWGYKADDGFEYGLNTTSHKRFIDFAAENNIQYLLIDADWYGDEFNENSDPTTSKEGVDIEECMRYAKEKNVGVILYLNDVGAKKFGLERVLKQFSEWGVIGVKYGFMRGTAEEKVKQTRKVVELCAQYKLMVNFHDNPVPPSGDRRTWPNLVTKEFGHSQADAKKSYFPEKPITSSFVNMIAGPIDMCNGWFDLNNAQLRVRVFEEIPGTVAAELAKLIVVYTGWAILPDSPEEYLKKDDLFDCIRKMPAQFDGFKVLDGEIGEFITVARKAGDNWFVGSLTNREARTIAIDLSFLPKDRVYAATFYEDADDSHFLNNKEDYQIRKVNIDSHTKLKVKLAPGGGNAIYISDELQIESQISKARISDKNKLSHNDYFTWGGSVIKGDDEKYHMFYARWPHGAKNRVDSIADKPFLGFKGWLKYSEIAYAVSDNPDGPFTYVKTLIRGSGDSTKWNYFNAHNPHIKRFNNKIYLYYIATNPLLNEEDTQNTWMQYIGGQRIGLVQANSIKDLISGNYEINSEPLIVPDNINTLNRVINPSVTQGPDGKYLMMFKSSSQMNGHGHMAHWIACSDNPEGPFKLIGPVFTDATYSAEDPYFWYDKKRNTFYAIVKDFSHSGKLTPQFGSLALITSKNGISGWKPSEHPLVSLRQYINTAGDTIKLAHLERPQLLLDEDGQALVLYAAASEKSPYSVHEPVKEGKPEHNSFNVQIKILNKEAETRHPNIVYILADDLGYGDVSCLNDSSKIQTPNLDKLAEQGIIFTDAHSNSAVCTPTRYGILTGRYAWRSRLKSGVSWSYDEHLIEPDRTTVASLLKEFGYSTACIGKWHLGLDWAKDTAGVPDFMEHINNSPITNGFDYFFGISASLDIPPYFYIENDRITATSIDTIEAMQGKMFWRKGPIGNDFKHIEVLPKLTEKAVAYIAGQSKTDEPFFLYFPLPAPHTPILPTREFQGKSSTNEYGDFVLMVDDVVHQIEQAIVENGVAENTLIIFTSDNGCSPMADFDELAALGHDPSYIFRGHKADIYEGGHRVPFIVKWSGKIKAGTSSAEIICTTDLLATCAAIVGDTLPNNAGEDSYNILPAMMGVKREKPIREATVHHSCNGFFSIRKGEWKLEFCAGSGGWSHPTEPMAKEQGLYPIQLYNLEEDISEQNNLAEQNPEIVKELTALMKKYIDEGRSTPGAVQSNEGETPFLPEGFSLK